MTMKSKLIGKRVRLKKGDTIGKIVNVFSHEQSSCYSIKTPDGVVQDVQPGEFNLIRRRDYRAAVSQNGNGNGKAHKSTKPPKPAKK